LKRCEDDIKTILVFLILFCLLGVASGLAQMPDTLKPKADSAAAGDTLAKKNYVLCPKCGRANYPEANYCIHCGEPFKQGLVRKVEEKPQETKKEKDDPAYTRLFIVPTGETLKRRTGYFGDSEIFVLQGGVGLADAFTLFGGSTIFPGKLDWQFVFGGPKLRLFKRGNISAAVGGVGVFNAHLDVVPWVAYGVATYGKTSGRLNLGVGKFGAGFGESTPWLFSIGGEAGKSNRSRWLWESWVWKTDKTERTWDGLTGSYYERKVGTKVWFPTCLGLRFFGENITGDLGLTYLWTSEGGAGLQVGIPLINVTYHFK
jgi:ribosomal protein L37E